MICPIGISIIVNLIVIHLIVRAKDAEDAENQSQNPAEDSNNHSNGANKG